MDRSTMYTVYNEIDKLVQDLGDKHFVSRFPLELLKTRLNKIEDKYLSDMAEYYEKENQE